MISTATEIGLIPACVRRLAIQPGVALNGFTLVSVRRKIRSAPLLSEINTGVIFPRFFFFSSDATNALPLTSLKATPRDIASSRAAPRTLIA